MPDHGPRLGRQRRQRLQRSQRRRSSALSAPGRSAIAPLLAAALLLAACSPNAPAASRGDSSAAAPAARTDSARGGAVRPSPDDAAPSGPVALATAAADSAARLDARFQELRAALNRDAAALDAGPLDRRSPEYAGRYDEIRRRTAVAESLRAARDAQRKRARTLGATAPADVRTDAPRLR